MRLDGIYQGENVNTPSGIRATGTPDEFKQVTSIPSQVPISIVPHAQQSDEHWTIYPAQREVVRSISRKVEVQCDDQRLIDWMAQG